MTKSEAINIAKKYKKHIELRKKFKKENIITSVKFHEGCMQMALQIFEENSCSHGYGSPEHAINDEQDL